MDRDLVVAGGLRGIVRLRESGREGQAEHDHKAEHSRSFHGGLRPAHVSCLIASRTTSSPSRNASSVMISGGLILIAPPPTPTGANNIRPDSTHFRTSSHAVSWSGMVVP